MRILLIAAFAALSACGTLPNYNSPDRLAPALAEDGTGVVLISTGAVSSCMTQATFLKIKKDGEGYMSDSRALLVDTPFTKSDFDDHVGFVHAIRLPAGKYYVAPWAANPYVTAVKIPRFDFTVTAGETEYIGEYFMPISCSLANLSGFADAWQRDSAVISRKNAKLDLSNVVHKLAVFGGNAVGN